MDRSYINGVLLTESKTHPETGKPFTNAERIQHSLMGIVTELGELTDIFKRHIYYGKDIDKEHLVEELGDLFWYLALGFEITSASVPEDNRLTITNPVCAIMTGLESITAFTRPFDVRIKQVYKMAWQVATLQGLDYEDILVKNLAKLRKRYGDSFDADRAINRDVAAEYEAMRDA